MNSLKVFLLFSGLIFLAACSKTGTEMSRFANEATVSNAANILTGEITSTNTRVYIGGYDPATLKYTYLWSKTAAKPLNLYFKQAKAAGSNEASLTSTLNIKADGSYTFSVDITSIKPWFVPGRDSVAGGIDVNSTPATGQWKFTLPSTIDANGETYLPMFFPPTLTTADNKVSAPFQTLGSVLAFEVTNNLAVPFSLDNFYLRSSSFRMNGTVTWAVANRRTGNLPGWTSAPAAADTSIAIKVSNLKIPAFGKDTFYVWVAQNANISSRIISTVSTGADYTDRIVSLRPGPTTPLADNKFYTLRLSIVSELMITEITDGTYDNGCFVELYNGSNVPVDLSNYYMYEKTFGKSERLPVYTLNPGKLVVLAVPPVVVGANDPSWLSDKSKVAAGVDVLFFSNASYNYFYLPYWNQNDFSLRKYISDPSTTVDRADTQGNPSFNWYALHGMTRNKTVLFPTATYNYTQWTAYPNADFNLNETLGER